MFTNLCFIMLDRGSYTYAIFRKNYICIRYNILFLNMLVSTIYFIILSYKIAHKQSKLTLQTQLSVAKIITLYYTLVHKSSSKRHISTTHSSLLNITAPEIYRLIIEHVIYSIVIPVTLFHLLLTVIYNLFCNYNN